MNVFEYFAKQIIAIARNRFGDALEQSSITVEFPKDATHGDLSTNIAMTMARGLGRPAMEIAKELSEPISKLLEVNACSIAAPGFINFTLHKAFWQDLLPKVFKLGNEYGATNLGNGRRVNLEFVSVNPTGPMHVGHSRGAIYGDALANLLKFVGFEVTKEYYINDAGNQINILAHSLFTRYQQALGHDVQLEEGCYPGEYLVRAAAQLLSMHGSSLLEMVAEDRLELLKIFSVDSMMALIKDDIARLGVTYDLFTSERHDILEKDMNDEVFRLLHQKGLIYRGMLEAPKGKLPDDWEPREQELFKSTLFGDDVDRPLKRADGSFTYFAGDAAYHLDKLRRGYDELIVILGADHSGYVKRIKALVNALSEGQVALDVRIYQFVNLLKNGEPFRMSKRAGVFITVSDVLDEVGKDILRFVMLSRKSDTALDLDFAKVREQTKDNPVFYVQYAHTRACSVLRKAEILSLQDVSPDFTLLKDVAELNLIKQIALFPKIVATAASSHEPHRITFYLEGLANHFHALWTKGSEHEALRFIIEDNAAITQARLILVMTVRNILATGLKILGINPLEAM